MEKFLLIKSDGNLEDKLFRVNKKTNLTLRPGPSCQALNVNITTNYPVKKGGKFQRSEYTALPLSTDHQNLISSAFNWHASVLLELSGTFHFICSDANGHNIWQAYIIVNPELKVPINSIKCQTVISKLLGNFSEWRRRLQITQESKFNMIHFTPVQELGSSQSAYSIRNHLLVNPAFSADHDAIKKEVDYMERKWGILSVTDIVLNHVASDCEWIHKHPECSYNLANSPHLRPAFLLDSAIWWLTIELVDGWLKNPFDLTPMITSENHIQVIGINLRTFYSNTTKIWELYMINVGRILANFESIERGDKLQVNYGDYERNSASVEMIPKHVETVQQLRQLLEDENLRKRKEIKSYIDEAVDHVMSAIRYERLNPNGPYYKKPVTYTEPLVTLYFNHLPPDSFNPKYEEVLMYAEGDRFKAVNGWVMGASPVDDFCSPGSNIYLKRELVAWGDCIKLRYGTGPAEVPYLWAKMLHYVETQVKMFHGIRIDNCHSTPLHVAEHFIDVARAIRPDLYIMAELFTSSESIDNIYVNRLGITSLIREAMAAGNCRELGRMVYRYGGTPVGAFYQHGAEPLKPSMAHAIFYDQTHDNQPPLIIKTPYDVPATTSVINMADCATGSNRGHDELVPHHINVVHEKRPYPLDVNESTGILPVRRLINGLLLKTLSDGFNEIFVDSLNDDIIAITRHNPVDGRSIVLVAHTAFTNRHYINPPHTIHIEGQVVRILFESCAEGDPQKYDANEKFINGLSDFRAKILNQNCQPQGSLLAKVVQCNENRAEIRLDEIGFPPSSVLAVEVCLSLAQSSSLRALNEWDLNLPIFDLNLDDANYILFRCHEEDNLEPYGLPKFCKFVYSGLYGLMYYLQQVREDQNQAHPLAVNLRQGNWLSEYIINRLRARGRTRPLADHLKLALQHVAILPRGMIPKYFDFIITKLYNGVLDLLYSRMSVFVNKGPRLVKLLALSSMALVGECKSAPLPQVETKLPYLPSLAAGLPHFASDWKRNWGRDTFISLRGLLLLTGRFSEARSIILSFARTLNHGLIPNLMNQGHNARYNCRDATWWWLYSICEYTKLAPNGNEILRQKVKRIHKPEPPASVGAQRKRSVAQMNVSSSDTSPQQLCDIIQEALECHFKGMEFVEDRAGPELDSCMTEPGFSVKFGVSRETGFVYGGNQFNCGTWMDKMGSSEKAKNKGVPASPRDGSAVEIVGLCKAVVSWLDELNKAGRVYPYDGVECLYDNTITVKWSWKKWAGLIQSNFEKYFYIPLEHQEANNDLNSELVNRRGIYKDTFEASMEWQDYQFRPNFLIAMVVAPELFTLGNAQHALRMVRDNLCGPLGMKTLDPKDWKYKGDYNNDDDSVNYDTAHGFNYHNGPEWLWLTSYYIRASTRFIGQQEMPHSLQLLANFHYSLVFSPWLGLPELTNAGGQICVHSCQIQAWSVGTALEALHETTRYSS